MDDQSEAMDVHKKLRKTGSDISTNSRFQFYEFTISTSRIPDFNFTNSTSRIQEFNFTNSTVEFVKLNS